MGLWDLIGEVMAPFDEARFWASVEREAARHDGVNRQEAVRRLRAHPYFDDVPEAGRDAQVQQALEDIAAGALEEKAAVDRLWTACANAEPGRSIPSRPILMDWDVDLGAWVLTVLRAR